MSSLIGLFALITPLLESTLTVPEVGEHSLRVLTPRLLEMHLVNTQQLSTEEIPTSPTTWDFLNFDGRQEMAPTTSSFEVDVDGSAFPVVGIGFRRQPLYAPLNQYDLRIGNSIFLLLGESVRDGSEITVRDRPEDDVDYLAGFSFATEVDPLP